jgi:hypothetical protein
MVLGSAAFAALPVDAQIRSLQVDVSDPGPPSMVSVRSMGASGDGRADDTGAFQRGVDVLAAAGGGTLHIAAGNYRTKTIHLPADPAVIRVVGEGPARSIWEMADPAAPILRLEPRPSPSRVTGSVFRSFGIRAHPEGKLDDPSHVAIDASGFNAACFADLAFYSNGRGSVHSWFRTSSISHPSYQQSFKNLLCHGNVGPGRVIDAAHSGSSLLNTNRIEVDGFWIYANDGMSVAFDLRHCTGYAVRNGLIESSALTAIMLGNSGVVQSVWIEDVPEPLRFSTTAGQVSASNNLLSNLYLSGFSGEIRIPRDCVNNRFQDVAGGNFRVARADPFGGNSVTSSAGFGAKPSILQVSGEPGRIKEVEAVCASGLDGLWHLLLHFFPPRAGSYGFRLQAPPGYQVKRLFASAMDGASGVAYPAAVGWPVNTFFTTVPSANSVLLTLQCGFE